jgi:hypothetical protein
MFRISKMSLDIACFFAPGRAWAWPKVSRAKGQPVIPSTNIIYEITVSMDIINHIHEILSKKPKNGRRGTIGLRCAPNVQCRLSDALKKKPPVRRPTLSVRLKNGDKRPCDALGKALSSWRHGQRTRFSSKSVQPFSELLLVQALRCIAI